MNTEIFLNSLVIMKKQVQNVLTRKFWTNVLSVYYSLWLILFPVVQALSYPVPTYAQAQTVTVEPTDDLFVESGSPTSTFTTDTFLRIKDRGASSTRESNLKFLLNGVTNISQAKLFVYARVSESGLPTNAPSHLGVYGIANDVWDQDTSSSTLTPNWNTKLALGSKIGETTVNNNGSEYVWYQVDVTSYVGVLGNNGSKLRTPDSGKVSRADYLSESSRVDALRHSG